MDKYSQGTKSKIHISERSNKMIIANNNKKRERTLTLG